MDVLLNKFYNDVKATEWDYKVENINDIYKLPLHIRDEMINDFNMYNRLTEIESIDYWSSSINWVYVYNNICFIPFHKCASKYYEKLFSDLGWHEIPLGDVPDDYYMISCIINPMKRYMKGLTQYICDNNLHNSDSYNILINTLLIPDVHTIPYTNTLGSYVKKIDFIPMDIMSDNEVKISLMKRFKSSGYKATLPLDDQRIHVSSSEKLEIYKDVINSVTNDRERLAFIYAMFCNDLALYRNVVENWSG